MPQVTTHPTYKSSSNELCVYPASLEHDLKTYSIEEREETSTTRIKTQLNRTLEGTPNFDNSADYFGISLLSPDRESHIQISVGDDDDNHCVAYNYDDLPGDVQLLSPKVTSLIRAGEALLESALISEEEILTAIDSTYSTDSEDNIGSELERLADAEQLLRDELNMSNLSFNMSFRNEEDNIQRQLDTTSNADFTCVGSIKGSTNESTCSNQEDANLETQLSKLSTTSTNNTNARMELEEIESDPSYMKSYTLYDHAIQIGLLYNDEDLGYPTCPLLTKSDADIIYNSPEISNRKDAISDLLNCTREYVKPMTNASLSRIYTGLVGDKRNQKIENENEEIAPVRAVTIEIRPDVLVDEVMDAIGTSVTSLCGKITTKGKGRLRALIPGRWMQESDYVSFHAVENKKDFANSSKTVFIPPIAVDAQLCTRKKSKFAERILLVRSYSINGIKIPDDRVEFKSQSLSSKTPQNTNLRESASLHQRMRKAATEGGNISFDLNDDPKDASLDDLTLGTGRTRSHTRFSFFNRPSKRFPQKQSENKQNTLSIRFDTIGKIPNSEHDPKILASDQLLSKFIESPSILDDDVDRISALSHLDWPYIQSTWILLNISLTELDKRNLSQSSLLRLGFGTSPLLPILDVHYCSQLKELLKEQMIAKLFALCNELETHAKNAEYGCTTLQQVLEPMAFSYQEDMSKFPKGPEIIPLNTYQLDYCVAKGPFPHREPQNFVGTQSCLQLSTIGTHDRSNNDFQRAREAMLLVMSTYRREFDQELSARIGQRNCYVMDRLAKCQAFMSESIALVRGSYGNNPISTKAANKFHANARDCVKADMESEKDSQLKIKILPASDQVPLLSCRVIVGGLGAMCYVTYHQLLLVSKRMPLVRGSNFSLVLLKDIEIEVKISSKKSRLSLVPSMVIVKNKTDGRELCSFRPATGAHLFKDFVDIVKKYTQSPDTVSFAPKLQMIADHPDEYS